MQSLVVGMFVVSTLLSACSGRLYTITDARAINNEDGKYLKGITAYPPRLFMETYAYTAYVVDGKVLRTADGTSQGKKCEPGVTHSIVTRPDYSSPYQLVYESGLLESKEFTVTLKDGMVTSVGFKGTPDRGETARNIMPSVVDVFGPVGLAAPDEKVLCNANPLLRDVTPYVAQ